MLQFIRATETSEVQTLYINMFNICDFIIYKSNKGARTIEIFYSDMDVTHNSLLVYLHARRNDLYLLYISCAVLLTSVPSSLNQCQSGPKRLNG